MCVCVGVSASVCTHSVFLPFSPQEILHPWRLCKGRIWMTVRSWQYAQNNDDLAALVNWLRDLAFGADSPKRRLKELLGFESEKIKALLHRGICECLNIQLCAMTRIIRLEKKPDGITQRHNQLFTMAGEGEGDRGGRRRNGTFTDEGGLEKEKKKPQWPDGALTYSQSSLTHSWCVTASDRWEKAERRSKGDGNDG